MLVGTSYVRTKTCSLVGPPGGDEPVEDEDVCPIMTVRWGRAKS